jgi:hypothetical protein
MGCRSRRASSRLRAIGSRRLPGAGPPPERCRTAVKDFGVGRGGLRSSSLPLHRTCPARVGSVVRGDIWRRRLQRSAAAALRESSFAKSHIAKPEVASRELKLRLLIEHGGDRCLPVFIDPLLSPFSLYGRARSRLLLEVERDVGQTQPEKQQPPDVTRLTLDRLLLRVSGILCRSSQLAGCLFCAAEDSAVAVLLQEIVCASISSWLSLSE